MADGSAFVPLVDMTGQAGVADHVDKSDHQCGGRRDLTSPRTVSSAQSVENAEQERPWASFVDCGGVRGAVASRRSQADDMT